MSLLKYDYDRWSDPFISFDSFLNRVLKGGLGRNFQPRSGYSSSGGEFHIDILSDEKSYTVVAELPGFSKENIDIQLHNAVLTINGERNQEDESKSIKLSRSITIGDDVNTAAVSAKMNNGLLTITLPKSDESKPKKISVN